MALTLNQITTTLKTIKNVKKFNLNSSSSFIQPFDIPENIIESVNDIHIDTATTSSCTSSAYVKNEIMEVPNLFENFLDLNNYYIYGADDIYESILILNDREYLSNTNSQKQEIRTMFLDRLLDELNTNYKNFEYKKNYVSKTIINDNLKSKNPSIDILKYICDANEFNILYINLSRKKYRFFKAFNQDDIKNNMVLLDYNGHVVPLIDIKYDAFSYKDLTKIKDYFNEIKILKKITSYSVADLTSLANEEKIDIYQENSKKKKTKQMLYDALKNIYE
tara:strand:+ start:1115 stop:1948 length:834 start_codon:yes stop_codon:yes gene_type:complete